MAAHVFNIMALPLELFRVILVQAMHVRELKRAVRLRLVNRLFASEVMQTLENTWFLENCELSKHRLGAIGSDFVARRLLTPSLLVSANWEGVRRIARRLASEDEDDSEENFARYIKILCHRANGISGSMKDLCNHDYNRDKYTDYYYRYDLICAAAYTGKLSIIDELGNSRDNLRDRTSTFYTVAV